MPFDAFAQRYVDGALARAAKREARNQRTHATDAEAGDVAFARKEVGCARVVSEASTSAAEGFEEAIVTKDYSCKLMRALGAALDSLPAGLRRILEMRYFEGRELAAIAVALRMSVATLDRRLRHGRELCRKRLVAAGFEGWERP